MIRVSHLQVRALVNRLDDAQVILEVGDETIALVGVVLGFAGDLAVQRLQSLARDTCQQGKYRAV